MRGDSFIAEDTLSGKAYDSRLARRLYQYLRPYMKYVVLGTVMLLASTGCQLIEPILVGKGIDNYMLKGDFPGLKGLL